MSKYVVDVASCDKRDVHDIGKYAAELGELSYIGISIPEGFVVTIDCFREFVKENRLALNSAEKQIMHLYMPIEILNEIYKAYQKLGGIFKESRVIVTLSSPFNGFNKLHHDVYEVKGDANLILKIKTIWAHSSHDIAIVVQKKIEKTKAGTLFTEDPDTSDKTKIVIEQDKNTHSHYLISKRNLNILFKSHLNKAKKSHTISDKEAIKLAYLGKKIQTHFYFPQAIEFAIDKDKIYILETKPMTNIASKPYSPSSDSVPWPLLPPRPYPPQYPKLNSQYTKRDILLKGICTFPGITTGPVRVYKNYKAIHNVIPSEILVVPKIEADLFPIIKRARGLITESVSFTDHDKMIYRKFVGKPIIQGAKNATIILHTGNVVTLNGTKGEIHKGGLN